MSGDRKIVPCTEQYWNFVRVLRNDKTVKKGFIQQEHIDWSSHKQYMRQNSENYRVCLYGEEPVGFVGSINGDIRIAVKTEFQGKGIGKSMIQYIMKEYPSSEAKVKIENESSIKMFESCGFKKKYYILEKEDETESL